MGYTPAIFTYLGLFVVLNWLRVLADYFWFHFLRPATDHKFLHGKSPYAVITGSTDGIGKCLAKILYAKGFNLILHGRNEEKVKRVIEEIQALHKRKDGKIKYFIADASESGHDFESIAKSYEDLNITLFINNVGGSDIALKTIDQRSERASRSIMNLNLDFPLFLTRAFLPQLRRVSQATGPVQVVIVGSLASEISLPFIWPYGGSKGFMKQVSCALDEEERTIHGPNLSFLYLNVGEVHSATLTGKPSFFRPPTEVFARSVVRSFGCGRRVVVPWYLHCFMSVTMAWVPDSVLQYFAGLKLQELLKEVKFSAE